MSVACVAIVCHGVCGPGASVRSRGGLGSRHVCLARVRSARDRHLQSRQGRTVPRDSTGSGREPTSTPDEGGGVDYQEARSQSRRGGAGSTTGDHGGELEEWGHWRLLGRGRCVRFDATFCQLELTTKRWGFVVIGRGRRGPSCAWYLWERLRRDHVQHMRTA